MMMRRFRTVTNRSEAGFSLMEAVIAAVILCITAAAVAGLLLRVLDVSQDATQRTVAANMAATQVEKIRAMRALDIPGGRTVLPAVTLGGTSYTLVQDATYVALDSGGDSCQGAGDPLAYKQVTITVTWTNMGTTKPVRTETVRSLGFGGDGMDPTKGAVAVKVLDALGAGVAGISVTVTSTSGVTVGTQMTSADGCLVFTGLAPGNYTASVNETAYVDTVGARSSTGNVFGVTAAALTATSLSYDRPGQLLVTLAPPALDFTPPAELGLTLKTSLWTGTQKRPFPDCTQALPAAPSNCVSGSPTRQADSLFPASYSAWAGRCADSAPSVGSPLTAVSSGQVSSLTATLGGVTVRGTGLALGKTFYAVHAQDPSDPTCQESYRVGVLPADGSAVKVALPFGPWHLQLSPTGGVATQRVVVQSGSVPSVLVLL